MERENIIRPRRRAHRRAASPDCGDGHL